VASLNGFYRMAEAKLSAARERTASLNGHCSLGRHQERSAVGPIAILLGDFTAAV
jgi:hypothetical protein